MLTRVALLTVGTLLAFCASAPAATILRLPRESSISSLTVTPDGSAWF